MSSLIPSGTGEQSNILAARQLPFLRPQSQSCAPIHMSTSMLSTSLYAEVVKSNCITAAACHVAGPQLKVSLRYLYLWSSSPPSSPRWFIHIYVNVYRKQQTQYNHNLTAAYPAGGKNLMLVEEGVNKLVQALQEGSTPWILTVPWDVASQKIYKYI